MRKVLGLALVIAALALTPLAVSATLSNGSSQTCDGMAIWHFVNNQTNGATAKGNIEVTFSGGLVVTEEADAVNKNTQHFHVETTGDVTLVDAETDLPGRLQLSDLSCDGGKKGGGGKK